MTDLMTISTSFNPTSGFLPPGRYSCDFGEAEDLLVNSPALAMSTTRADIWLNFGKFLTEFLALETKYPDLCESPLLDRVWLGGSFVSTKLDPRNIDATVFLNAATMKALRGNPGSGIFTKSRESWLRDFSVSPLFVEYHPVAKIFNRDKLEDHELAYFADRGRWDDWWQRCRLGEKTAPSVESAYAARGYLEVII